MKPVKETQGLPKQRRISWSVLVLALGAMVLGISVRTAAINPQTLPLGSRQFLAGVVTDSICGSSHFKNGRGDAECTRDCVKGGADYALVGTGRMLILKGHEAELNDFAGGTVLVTGVVTGNKVAVESVTPVHLPFAPVYAVTPSK